MSAWLRALLARISPQRRLLGRVYLYGAVLIFSTGLALFLVSRLLLFPRLRPDLRPLALWAAENALTNYGDPDKLHADLLRMRVAYGMHVCLFSLDGKLRDSNVPAPLAKPFAPLPPREVERLAVQQVLPIGPPSGVAFGLFDAGHLIGYGEFAPEHPEFPGWRVSVNFLVVLAALAVASVPFARSLTRPLERLAATVRAFGKDDTSVRVRLDRQDEVGDVARAWNEMADRIERLLLAEKELLANVSHELRTPLARIRVVLELADGDERRADYLAEIAEDLAELERMVDDILTAARLDLAHGRASVFQPLRFEQVDVRQVLARSVARFGERHPDRPLSVDVAETLPPLRADAAMLRRVVDNLLDNADKYSNPDCDIDLSARLVGADGGPGTLEIVVTDHGIGIEADDLARLFTPFFRTDRSRARKTGGVGLGLALARRIARAHGGDVTLRSEVGSGTVATVRLPVSPG